MEFVKYLELFWGDHEVFAGILVMFQKREMLLFYFKMV